MTSHIKKKLFIQNLSLIAGSILLTFLVLEIFFRFFFAQSDEFNYTLASKNWFDRYWTTNSLGYRDYEWTQEDIEKKTAIMILGDSFVAGQGVANPDDRFPDVLAQMLGQQYVVFNVGKNGAGTQESIELAKNYPYEADLLVYSYYINDIQDTAIEYGHWPYFQIKTNRLVESSHAINFLYWRVIRLGPQKWRGRYSDWLLGVYDDPKIWAAHERELTEIQRLNSRLIVIVWPSLAAIEESIPVSSKVIDFYSSRGVPVLDVGALIQGRPVGQLIANKLDTHPNEAVHQLVAAELYPMVIQELKQ